MKNFDEKCIENFRDSRYERGKRLALINIGFASAVFFISIFSRFYLGYCLRTLDGELFESFKKLELQDILLSNEIKSFQEELGILSAPRALRHAVDPFSKVMQQCSSKLCFWGYCKGDLGIQKRAI